jgi:hypothetical protein
MIMGFIQHTKYFERINSLSVGIDNKKKALGSEQFSRQEQVLDNIWTAIGILENGSFQYFFECGLDADTVAKAHEEIEMTAVSILFKDADRIVASVSRKPWKERLAFLKEHEDELDSIAANILKHTCAIEDGLYQYIQEHPQVFQLL